MVPPPAPQNTSAIDGNGYQDALDRLQPLQPVLRGFNHRNRNQHRRAAWWAPFGMLRRHVERVVDELLEASNAVAVAAAAAASKSKSKKRRRDDDDDDSNSGGVERKVRGHVEWLRDVLIPKCYLAFSQLTADNQFAALGVVLLGALAQVNAACAHLVGAAAEISHDDVGVSTADKPVDGSDAAVPPQEPSVRGPKDPPSRPILAETSGGHGGSVISRDEVARAEKLREKLRKKGVQVGSSDMPPSHAQRGRDQGNGSKVVKTKEGVEPTKTKKTKKPKKGGDEFDDLFKSLF
ncbi:hypothetical protein F4814DRAFT_418227 [Daldinia grandis]|nr:hypothetical protein F4814DRAFT_418227 [Daldinia grandis]